MADSSGGSFFLPAETPRHLSGAFERGLIEEETLVALLWLPGSQGSIRG